MRTTDLQEKVHLILITLLTTIALTCAASVSAQSKDSFRIAWSIYVGWMPWDYGEQSGIVDKWAEKYGIEIEIVQINDYIESINQYTVGEFDGVTITNMDTLTIPAAGGIDSTALIVGDFSNGNDGIILKNNSDLASIAGQNVNLVELSVSHYLLARALDTVGLRERDLKVVNTSDADLVAAFISDDVTAVTTWNPLLSEITAMPDANLVFDSSQIPGEIIDLLVVNSETLEANPDFGKALVGAWYEIMSIMSDDSQDGVSARISMAIASGTDLAGYQSQLESTNFFFDPEAAVQFTKSDALIQTMQSVAEFSFNHGILGEGASSPDFIGMQFPGGRTWGDSNNIKFRFNTEFMAAAAAGEL